MQKLAKTVSKLRKTEGDYSLLVTRLETEKQALVCIYVCVIYMYVCMHIVCLLDSTMEKHTRVQERIHSLSFGHTHTHTHTHR
jgi:hypothetical protein